MDAMICKMEDGFEPEFFEVITIDDLLTVLCEHDYPYVQITIGDDENGDPRMSVEILSGGEWGVAN